MTKMQGAKPGTQPYNKNGVSLIFEKTNKGQELLRKIDTSNFVIGDAEIDVALRHNRMFEISRAKTLSHDSFGADFKEHGLHYACLHSSGYKAYRKAAWKNMIKRVFRL
ncbi:MAG: hypothetical protein IKB34_07635 [Clostridia bacterium]|nr:hypothetical protein [Clostridia bacterium]